MYKLKKSLLLSVVLFGCQNPEAIDGDKSNANQHQSESPIVAQFLVLDKFDQRQNEFIVGDEVSFMFEIVNSDDKPFVYQDTAPSYGIQIRGNNGVVWSSDHGTSVIQVIQEFTIAAGESRSIEFVWAGQDNQGDPLPIGIYSVEPRIDVPIDEESSAVPASVTVQLK